MNRPLRIRGALVWDGTQFVERTLCVSAGRIVDSAPPAAIDIDLPGLLIFPGLVNAHDHLELNHYPRTRCREHYNNAHQWGEDVNARLDHEPFHRLRMYPLWDRLFIGALKNLLSGVTTVFHHGPHYRPMFSREFPVNVLRKYGWAHSLHFASQDEVVRSFRRTPPQRPWFIHLAEGTDDTAAGEYDRLRRLGCARPNTVIVHGTGLLPSDRRDAAIQLRGLVWCPTTNDYLLGDNGDARTWLDAGGTLALGSDSRLTAQGDLLDELQAALQQLSPAEALAAVTTSAAQLAGWPEIGHLDSGARADFIVCEPAAAQSAIPTRPLLVVRGGQPLLGTPEIMAQFPHVQSQPASLYGSSRSISDSLAKLIHRCTLKVPGLSLSRTSQYGVTNRIMGMIHSQVRAWRKRTRL